MRQALTIERTTTILLFMLLFALATRIPLDTDTWWHLRAGEYMIETRSILQGDPFSHTRFGEVRVQADWLSQVILYGVWQIAGDFGLALFTSILATAGVAMLYRASEGNAYLRAFVMVLGASTAAVFWSARPQMFSFLLSAWVILILFQYKRRQIDHLWALIPIMLIWGNLHGGYFLGLLLIYGVIGGEILNLLLRSRSEHRIVGPRLWRLIGIAILSTLVLLINPAGPDLLLLPLQTFTMGALRSFIQEWNPPNLLLPEVWPFNALLILTVGLVIAHWRKLDWTEAALVIGSAYLALTTARNIAFFAVIATPILTYHLYAEFERRGWSLQTIRRPTRMMIRLNTVLIVVIGIACLAKVLLVLDQSAVDAAKRLIFPVDAATYLATNDLPQPMFNSYNWGGYLMVHARDYPVFVDGRTDLYGDLVFEYAAIAFAQDDWRTRLDTYRINLIFIENNSPLALALTSDESWRLVYEDERAVIYVREVPR